MRNTVKFVNAKRRRYYMNNSLFCKITEIFLQYLTYQKKKYVHMKFYISIVLKVIPNRQAETFVNALAVKIRSLGHKISVSTCHKSDLFAKDFLRRWLSRE